jgi:predicted ATPase
VRYGEHWRSVREPPHGLPADAFISRSDALRELAALTDGGSRLIRVLVMDGIGKTRLALRYACGCLGEYDGGAWFCDLSAARSVDGLVHAVAQGLELPLGKAEPARQIGGAIAGRGACLVVLDNFEQVAARAEATLGAWLGPRCRPRSS